VYCFGTDVCVCVCVCAVRQDGNTALIFATQNGFAGCVTAVLQQGVDTEAKNKVNGLRERGCVV
jgi:hypothetical protein